MIDSTGNGAGADTGSLGQSARPKAVLFSSGLDSIYGPGFERSLLKNASTGQDVPAAQEIVPPVVPAGQEAAVKPSEAPPQTTKVEKPQALEIDTKDSKTVGPDGKPLTQRSLEDIKNIKIREGHKDGEPEANFVIDKDGKIKQLRAIDLTSAGGSGGGGDVIIEIDDSAGSQARAANASQKSALRALVAQIESQCLSANRDPEIPPSLLAALDAPANIPAPRIIKRGGGGGGTAGWGGGGGSMGGNGSFFNPGVPPASFATDNAILPSSGGGGVAPMPSSDSGAGVPAPSPAGFDGGASPGGGIQPGFDFSQMGGIDTNNPVDKVVALVSANEGKPNSINWNDNGHGISVGLFQANQKSGELPMLLNKMAEANPQLFNQVFGAQAGNMRNEQFVRSANFSQNNELGRMMQDAVNRPEFQKVQLDMMREKVAHASQVAGNYGIKSELGVALTADMINQLGEAGAKKHLAAAGGKGHEQDKIRAVVASSETNQWRAGRFERIASSGSVGMDHFRMA
jgi:hypothetical protein